MTFHSHLSSQIKKSQLEALKPENVANEGFHGMEKNLVIKEDGEHHLMDQIWLPKFGGFRDVVMN